MIFYMYFVIIYTRKNYLISIPIYDNKVYEHSFDLYK